MPLIDIDFNQSIFICMFLKNALMFTIITHIPIDYSFIVQCSIANVLQIRGDPLFDTVINDYLVLAERLNHVYNSTLQWSLDDLTEEISIYSIYLYTYNSSHLIFNWNLHSFTTHTNY